MGESTVTITCPGIEAKLNKSQTGKVEFGNTSVPIWQASYAIGVAHAALKVRDPTKFPADKYDVYHHGDGRSFTHTGPSKELKTSHIRFISFYQGGGFIHAVYDGEGIVFVKNAEAVYCFIKHIIPQGARYRARITSAHLTST